MPLRDHFRTPTSRCASWEAVNGGWPAMMVMSLNQKLPDRFVAHPRVHHKLNSVDEYEVRLLDTEHDQRLVATIELVSPTNKDRPESRRAFVAKCTALLQEHVSVTIVDLVTIRESNLYAELLDFIGVRDSALGNEPPPTYAAACRTTKPDAKPGTSWQLETWFHEMKVGQPLPTLPLWVADDFAAPLELEATYEETCKGLRIP